MMSDLMVLLLLVSVYCLVLMCGLAIVTVGSRADEPEQDDPAGHVTVLHPPSELEDAVRMSWWDAHRARLPEPQGRTPKVGVDVHSSLCADGCVCGLLPAGEDIA